MKAQLLCSVALITGTLSMTAFAEAPVQAGETLESLSQVKVSTTVNGQPGSIADLVNSGKVQVIAGAQPSAPDATRPLLKWRVAPKRLCRRRQMQRCRHPKPHRCRHLKQLHNHLVQQRHRLHMPTPCLSSLRQCKLNKPTDIKKPRQLPWFFYVQISI